jgi:hypothetical protein
MIINTPPSTNLSTWESAVLAGKAFVAGANVTASAGNQAIIGLNNPTGSGKNVILCWYAVQTNNNQSVNIGLTVTAFGAAGGNVMKLSNPAVGGLAVVLVSGSIPLIGAAPTISQLGYVSGVPFQFQSPITQVAPGYTFFIQEQGIANMLTVSFYWVEL